ncbi:unnamed protein product [Phytomonas sp. Hart1]|nr:unnamed protein product [Phytomonas sp. Hart1]|eukprot:CCW69935.1 unnamed protein product [Phytomonas sp. isolate Hart1]
MKLGFDLLFFLFVYIKYQILYIQSYFYRLLLLLVL